MGHGLCIVEHELLVEYLCMFLNSSLTFCAIFLESLLEVKAQTDTRCGLYSEGWNVMAERKGQI